MNNNIDSAQYFSGNFLYLTRQPIYSRWVDFIICFYPRIDHTTIPISCYEYFSEV